MYQKRQNRSFSSRGSKGGPRSASRGGYRGGSSRSGFKGGRRGGGGGGRTQHIDISRFISKELVAVEKPVPFVPTHKFVDFKIDENLKKNITKKGYENPTAIQDKTIPLILEGKDIIGIANTGTGKTGAFLIPLIDKILKNRREQILIVAPTRELALQIDAELRGFAQGMRMFSVVCVGGAPIGPQMGALRRPHNFIIGTPGRIKDLIERKKIDLSTFSTIVMDEADRMLDMGFINDMRFMISKMSDDRHTLLFSATLSREIEKIVRDFLTDEVRVSVKTQDTSKNVHQDIVRIGKGQDKLDILEKHLKDHEFEKVIVFGKTKHGVEKIAKKLSQKGFKTSSIHGNKNHAQRQRALKLFKQGLVQILVATDVAARGLDISDVSHVINYDIPATYDDYVHRIGRTGRGEKTGKALTFVG